MVCVVKNIFQSMGRNEVKKRKQFKNDLHTSQLIFCIETKSAIQCLMFVPCASKTVERNEYFIKEKQC